MEITYFYYGAMLIIALIALIVSIVDKMTKK